MKNVFLAAASCYSDCLCASILILEVYYRHLPLYQQDATLLKIPEFQATQ